MNNNVDMNLAIKLLDEMVAQGKIPKKGAVFGSDDTGYLDYEGVKNKCN